MSSAQLIGQLHYICRKSGFELRSSHLFTLRVEFLAIKLLDKKKLNTNINNFDQLKKNKNYVFSFFCLLRLCIQFYL
jgi:hypothetical protein